MQSMTGFGMAHTANNEIRVSIRAVNGRYFEPRFHLAKEWMTLESELKKRLAKEVSRGTIDIYVQTKNLNSGGSNLKLNLDLAKEYIKGAGSLKKLIRSQDQISLDSLLRLPSIFSINDDIEISGEHKKRLLSTFDKALSQLKNERIREGQSIAKDIGQRLKALLKLHSQMKALRESANSELEKKLEQRLKQKSGVEVDPSRFAQEMIFYLDRNDIGEEISRLHEHILEFQKLLNSKEPIGKKLDFFSQELLREVNTIGSKANLVDLTQLVVEAKTQIESIREQVQNIQ